MTHTALTEVQKNKRVCCALFQLQERHSFFVYCSLVVILQMQSLQRRSPLLVRTILKQSSVNLTVILS